MTKPPTPLQAQGRPAQALILVGGRGTRLGALAADTPKPLMAIKDGRLFLDYLILNVARHGVKDIVLLAGHLGELVEARYQGTEVCGAKVRVICEPAPAGTAGALVHAMSVLDSTFFLMNGDGFLDFNLLRLAQAPLPAGGARLALRRIADTSRYGSVILDGRRITAFREKVAEGGPGLINGGVYWMTKSALDHIVSLPASLEQDIFPLLAGDDRLEGLVVEGYFIDIGLPHSLEQARADLPAVERRPAVIFDRDGTLNVDGGYTHLPDKLEWIDGAREAIRSLNDAGWYVIVATNQAGVARGLYEESDVDRFHEVMQDQLALMAAHIDAFYHCPYHEDAVVHRYRHPAHPDRKPRPGMLHRALKEWRIDVGRSLLIGDRASDVAAAEAAGLRSVLFEGGDLVQALAAAGVPAERHDT